MRRSLTEVQRALQTGHALVDNTAVTGDEDDKEPTTEAPPRLERLAPLYDPQHPVESPPAVRLLREFKGLTVADLERDEIVARLPGQVRSALRHIQRGDLAAAERALPGEFAPVLAGPGCRPATSRAVPTAVSLLVLLAVLAATYWLLA